MCGEPGFPHEMGVLLGYPVEDVRGFMEQNGQNALYQGYWKVYAHVPDVYKRQYEGFAHMDYAKSIYNVDIHRALELLNSAKKIFEEFNEPRRLLDCMSEIAFINAIIKKDYSLFALQNICKNMQEKRYIQSYTRTCLKILFIMLLTQHYTLEELLTEMNKILMKNTTIETGKRHQAIACLLYTSCW